MAGTTMGYVDNAKETSKTQIQGTFRCSCGGYRGGVHTVAKGSKQTWTCSKCKMKVTVLVPK